MLFLLCPACLALAEHRLVSERLKTCAARGKESEASCKHRLARIA